MRKFLFMAALLGSLAAVSQHPGNWAGHFYKGYSNSIKGGGFQYHSPQPDVTSSLLLRSIDSVQYIEWETETIPGGVNDSAVNLVWMFGIDANTDSHRFKLFVNGKYCLTFANPLSSEMEPWKVAGIDGSSLLFRTVILDKYADPMGYAVLRLPAGMIEKGRKQRIRIVGESKESRTWYMTFEAGVEEKLVVRQVPALVRGDHGNSMPVLFQFVHLGEPVRGTILIPGIPETSFTLETGFNEVKVMFPEATPPTEYTATITISGEKPYSKKFTISPFRHFTIYLVQHTHTDIGYTRPQTEILPDHLRYIDYALDFCDQTDSLPDDARFRWTCETSWAVREYLRTRPASQLERLRKRVSEGRIELTGLFLNSSDLADETMVAATLQPVREFRNQGFPLRAAMQSDINGIPWCLADYLSGAGIEYLNMAQNTTRADKPFDNPTTFWWVSPSGSRILVNRPEHYMWGNSLGILSRSETFGGELFRHLQEITEKGYPFDHYAIQFSGYLTDNSPPSTTACKLVEEWNKTYAWPKLRLATISEFMDYMKQNHADELPVVRGAWPDWWMDGFGSAAIQTAYARTAHADYIANQGLMSMTAIMGVPQNKQITELQAQVTDDIAFYDEHTFGAAESITDPLCENSVVQLGEKESYVWSAVKKNRILREEVMGQVQQFIPRSGFPTIAVFNTLNWRRSGDVMVYIDHQLLPKDKEFRILDAGNQVMAMQVVTTREEGTWWTLHVKDVPPLGYAVYRIAVDWETKDLQKDIPFSGVLENEFYRLTVDAESGKITGLYDKAWKKELLDKSAAYSMGEFIYERLGKNRGQLEQRRLDEFTRKTWQGLKVSGIHPGPVWKSITLSGQMEGCADPSGIRCEIRLYNLEKKLEFCYSMKKLAVTDPEGVYIAFPFKLEGSHHVAEVAGGTMIPGKEQLEGSASDWCGIQDFVSLRNDSGQIVFVSPEIPLVQLGEINLGKFRRVG
ncbi:MAG: glycoside hydrolase family 38 C-terminal domain-containing protein, partial [bacterium]